LPSELASALPENERTREGSSRTLMILVYLQVAFLAITYVVGVWLTTEVHGATITLPEVVVHGVSSSGFALLTGLVAFLAAVQGARRVALANALLFIYTVVAGSTGFLFLGDTSSAAGITATNISMMVAIGLGMPITGYSLSQVARSARGEGWRSGGPSSTMISLALGALALTVVAGSGVPSTTIYAVAVTIHVGFAALTVSLVLGVLLLSVLEGAESSVQNWVEQRVVYSLFGLAAISIAAADGVIGVTGGGIPYIVVMGEVGVLVYVFLIVAAGAPYGWRFKLWPMRLTRRAR
jgi:hypothetical protein